MKKRTLLVLILILLLGILFPFATVARFWSGYAVVFNRVFDFQLSHILTHAALFGVLCGLLLVVFGQKSFGQRIWIALAGVLLAALGQEAIQMISTGTSDFGAAFFDLGVDLAGTVIALSVFILFHVNKQRYLRNASSQDGKHE